MLSTERPLREKKKEQTKRALFEAALELFTQRGYESTTVDQIAVQAGVSRRTFFRYHKSKEASVFSYHHERLERFRAYLEQEAHSDGGFGRVRHAFLALAEEYTAERSALVLQQRVIASSASLQSYDLQLDREWEEAIAAALERELEESKRAHLWAGAIIGVVRVVLREWFEGGGRDDLVRLGEEVFDLLERGLQARSSVTKRGKKQ